MHGSGSQGDRVYRGLRFRGLRLGVSGFGSESRVKFRVYRFGVGGFWIWAWISGLGGSGMRLYGCKVALRLRTWCLRPKAYYIYIHISEHLLDSTLRVQRTQ